MYSTGDDPRFSRALRSSHTVASRVEVWSDGELLSRAAPFSKATVTVHRPQPAGIVANLSLEVKRNGAWDSWIRRGGLEVRPYRGIRYSPTHIEECPLYRFPLLEPDTALGEATVQFSAADYYSYVVDNDFEMKPVTRTGGRIVDAIWWWLVGAGLSPQTMTTSQATSGNVTTDKTRAEAIAEAARAASVEVAVRRDGAIWLIDPPQLGTPTAELLTGRFQTAAGVAKKPDWSRVYNKVIVRSSAQDIGESLGVVTTEVVDPQHPAHPTRLGSRVQPRYRTYTFVSPLLTTRDQMVLAAITTLARVSSRALTYEYTCFPDPRMDPGDTVLGATPDGTATVQIEQITHPLHLEYSKVTTSSTQAPAPEAT